MTISIRSATLKALSSPSSRKRSNWANSKQSHDSDLLGESTEHTDSSSDSADDSTWSALDERGGVARHDRASTFAARTKARSPKQPKTPRKRLGGRKHKSRPENENDHPIDETIVKMMEVRMWYSLQDRLPDAAQELFNLSAEELLEKDPAEIDDWLAKIEDSWEEPVNSQTEKSVTDKNGDKDAMSKHVEVLTWFALSDQFRASQQNLFELPAEERLKQSDDQIDAWLDEVKSTFDENQGIKPQIPGSKGGSAINDDGMMKEIEVRTWFSLHEEFNAFDDSLFEMSADDRLQQRPEKLRKWLKEVQSQWDLYQSTQQDEDSEASDDESVACSVVNAIEIRTWFSLQEEYGVLDESLFRLPMQERIRQRPDKIEAWLQLVQAEWEHYEESQGKNKPSSQPKRESISKDSTVKAATAAVAAATGVSSAASVATTVTSTSAGSFSSRSTRNSLSSRRRSSAGSVSSTLSSKSINSASSVPSKKSSRSVLSRLSSKRTSSRAVAKAAPVVADSKDPIVNDIEVRTWFSLQAEFNAFDKALFEVPAEERLQQDPDEIKVWLALVEKEWDVYQKTQSGLQNDVSDDEDEDSDNDDLGIITGKSVAYDDDCDISVASAYSTVNDIEVRTWYSLQDEFSALDESLFKLPVEKRIQQSPGQIKTWLSQVQVAWDRYEAGEADTSATSVDDSDSNTASSDFPMEKVIEVRTWFSLQEEFHALSESLFEVSLDDRLKQHPDEIDAWLEDVQTAWDCYEENISGKGRVAPQ